MNTVRVKSSHPGHEQGFYVINESDFDEAVHELWVDEAAEAKKAAAAKAAQVNAGKPVLGIAAGRDERNQKGISHDRAPSNEGAKSS